MACMGSTASTTAESSSKSVSVKRNKYEMSVARPADASIAYVAQSAKGRQSNTFETTIPRASPAYKAAKPRLNIWEESMPASVDAAMNKAR